MDLKSLPIEALQDTVNKLRQQVSFLAQVEAELVRRTSTSSVPIEVFVPKFQENVMVRSALGGEWPVNVEYFATPETAQWIANKFGDGTVLEQPFGGSGGPYSCSNTELWVRLKSGRPINAGVLAAFYKRNPPDKFPGLAEQMIKDVLRNDGENI
jgi:hypothetical protein